MGAYHTLDLELNREFTIEKNNWDTVSLELVQRATDPTQYADVAAGILFQFVHYEFYFFFCFIEMENSESIRNG
jgi:stalled ribosome rescue protein Dom34